MVLVERDGNARVLPVERVNTATLKAEIRATVDRKSTIMSDENAAYRGIGREYEGGHRTVKHSVREYARFDADGVPAHVNTAESFFALIKRAHYGVFHQISKKHLHRYTAEFGFRWDHRKESVADRTNATLRRIGGKRLKYETPCAC